MVEEEVVDEVGERVLLEVGGNVAHLERPDTPRAQIQTRTQTQNDTQAQTDRQRDRDRDRASEERAGRGR